MSEVVRFFCLHGNFGSESDWEPLRAPLAHLLGGVRFECPDLWALPVEGWREELAERFVAGRRDGEESIIVGYSLGARLALELLRTQTMRCDRLVLCSVNPGLTDERERGDRLAADKLWADRVADRGASLQQIFADWDSQPVFAGSEPLRRTLPRGEAAEAGYRAAVGRRFVDWSLGTLPPTWETLAKLAVPALCVVGGRDAKFRSIADKIGALGNSKIKTAVIGEAGHRCFFDRPFEAAQKIAHLIEVPDTIGVH